MSSSEITLEPASAPELPPVVAGHESPVVVRKVEGFYQSVAGMFEAWVARSENYHTQRCYRRDVESFVEFLGIRWPEDSWQLLRTSVQDVRDWRTFMARGAVLRAEDAQPEDFVALWVLSVPAGCHCR